MKKMQLLRNFLACLLALVLILLLAIPVLLVAGLCRYDKFLFALSRFSIRLVLKTVGVRTRVRGMAGIDFSVPMVVICNHLSNLDGPLLISTLPFNPRVLIKNESRRIPLIGILLRLADFVFVDRQNPQRRQEALNEAVAKINEKGYSFLVFPEGTRSKNGRVQHFKKGGFVMALKAGVPVLPVRISGSHRLMPPGRMAIRSGTVEIDFFEPLVLSAGDESRLPEIIQALQQKIYAEKKYENHRS